MSLVAIRKSGGANIVSLPKAVLDQFGLGTGSVVDISVEDNRIVLTPASTEPTLEGMLAGSPREALLLTEEDHEWLNSRAVGKENIG